MSTRLNEVKGILTKIYTHIWDTCCDHGKLGELFSSDQNISQIHFVDCVPQIINRLQKRLEASPGPFKDKYRFHIMSGENIFLDKSANSLVCICGVGGETAIKICQGLLKNNSTLDFDILFCIQYHTIELRKYLLENKFYSQEEFLCIEGKWAHEVLLVNQKKGNEIDPSGKNIFNKDDTDHMEHLNKLITHYSIKTRSDPKALARKKWYEQILK